MKRKKSLLIVVSIILIFPWLYSDVIKKPADTRILKINLPDLTASFRAKLVAPDLNFLKRKGKVIKAVVKNIGGTAAKNFYVDFALASYNPMLSKGVEFSPAVKKYTIIKGAGKLIKSLAPGASLTISLQTPLKIPKQYDYKNVFLGVLADSKNTVTEKTKTNNYDWIKYKVYAILISSIGQMGYMQEYSTGDMDLTINGTGFGSSPGNKQIHLGQYVLPIFQYEYTNTYMMGIIPPTVPFGVNYEVFITQNNIRISNKKSHLLKFYIESCCREVGNEYLHQGPAGSDLQIHGAYFGSSQGNFQIRFGGVNPSATSWTNSRIDFTCPNLPPGGYQVYITKNGQDMCFTHGYFDITAN